MRRRTLKLTLRGVCDSILLLCDPDNLDYLIGGADHLDTDLSNFGPTL